MTMTEISNIETAIPRGVFIAAIMFSLGGKFLAISLLNSGISLSFCAGGQWSSTASQF